MVMRLLEHAFILGKDSGAFSAFQVAVVHPKRVTIIIILGIPFILPGISILLMHLLPKGF